MKKRIIILLTILTVIVLSLAIHVSYVEMIVRQGNESSHKASKNFIIKNPLVNDIKTQQSLGTKEEYYSLYTLNNEKLISFHTIDGDIQYTLNQLSNKELEQFRKDHLKKYNLSADSKIMYVYENNLPCLLIKDLNDDYIHNVYFNMLDENKFLKEYKVYK